MDPPPRPSMSLGVSVREILCPPSYTSFWQKVMGCNLSRAKTKGTIKENPLHQGEEALSHLQFMDDNILMGFPTTKEVQYFKKKLDLFNMASSTVINQDKS
jgi:hypothetical protein